MARRAGVLPGEARRVILRDWKYGLYWKPQNRFKNVSVITFFNFSFAQISILMRRRRIYDLRRFRKNLSRLNLSSSDGATGAGLYDFVAKNGSHEAHEARTRDILRFTKLSNDQNFLKY